jgi:putative ABC transport system permease protein
VFVLLSMEGLSVTVLGALIGAALLAALAAALAPLVEARYGLAIVTKFVSVEELRLLGSVVGAGLLVSLVPGYRAYQLSLADGLTPRI